MSLKQHFGTLSPEDLNRWRMVRARQRGIEARASNYSRQEIESAFIDEWKIMAEFTLTYGFPPGMSVVIYSDTGLIEEDEE